MQQQSKQRRLFNTAPTISIPKEVGHTAADGSKHFLPHQLRPLSIVNANNRLLASAARLWYEEHIASLIGSAQRGFLNGHSMLHNFILMDSAMRIACANSDQAGAVFF